jgi:hypothetical protein
MAGLTTATVIELCANELRRSDDDWLRAGMHLGLISNAVLFGVQAYDYDQFPMSFADAEGQEHFIAITGLPGSELGYQGDLSDITRKLANRRVWQTLGWERLGAEAFRFTDEPKIILDFDLDCFRIDWRDYKFPFPDEVFEKEFLAPSTYITTMGLSGRDFVHGLAQKAGLITVATEPECCGGDSKVSQILNSVDKYVLG